MDVTKITHLLTKAITAALEAGHLIMSVYRTDFEVIHKADQSPLTLADQKANDIIEKYLENTGMPILSEESRQIPYGERKEWKRFWLVDPLDGTKEFIKRNDEFTVNIALVDDGIPVMGIVYAPALDILYFGMIKYGAYKLDCKKDCAFYEQTGNKKELFDINQLVEKASQLPLKSAKPRSNDEITIVGSRSHGGPELEKYLAKLKEKYRKVHFKATGSSLKICLVAEGVADRYPRLGPTMEWDTAAGHAVASAAGADVLQFNTKQPLLYNKKDLLNPWFMVAQV